MIYCDDCGAITDKNHGPEDGAIRCARCSGATEESPASNELSMLDDPMVNETGGFQSSDESMEDLDLFSSETIAHKRSVPAPTEDSTLTLVEDDVFGLDQPVNVDEFDLPDFSQVEDNEITEDSDFTEEVESWQFDCLACAGRLSVTAVTERSKVNCPRCETWMVIDVDGEVILPGDEFGAPQPSCSSQELEQLRQEVHRIADDIGTFDDMTENDAPSMNGESDADRYDSDLPSAGFVSPAALAAAEMQAAGGDVITAIETDEETVETPPASVTTPADDLTAALSALASGEDLPEADLHGEATVPPLTKTTIGVYTVLFTLPSLVVLSAWHAGADSPAYQALLRFGTQVEQNGGQLLNQIARFFAGV